MPHREVSIRAQRSMGGGRFRAVIAANNEVAGSPHVVDLEQLGTGQYLRNPVVLWMHDQRNLPVARTTSLQREGAVWEAEFEFLPGDDRAERVQNAWERGFLNAASINWDEDTNELLEWSFVGVPADPDALRVTHMRMIDAMVSDRKEPAMAEEVTPAFDAEQFRKEVMAEVAATVEAALSAAPAPQEPAAAVPSQEAAPVEQADMETEIAARAHARADLLVSAAPFVPGVDMSGMSDEQILRAALGPEAGGSVEYMRGQLHTMSRARAQGAARAAEQRSSLRAAPEQPEVPPPLISNQADEMMRVYDPNITAARNKVYSEYVRSLETAWMDNPA